MAGLKLNHVDKLFHAGHNVRANRMTVLSPLSVPKRIEDYRTKGMNNIVVSKVITRSKLHEDTRKSRFHYLLAAPLPFIHVPSSAASDVPCDSLNFLETMRQVIPVSLNRELLKNLVLADIDPATAKLAISFLGPFLSAFGFLFILRIVMSWYPKLPVEKFPYIIAYAPTEPFLSVTRKLIPPLAGVDVTPVVWFGLISFLNEILVGPQGLLVLLSQQV